MSIPLDAVSHKGTPDSPEMDWATLRMLLNLAMDEKCHHLVWQPSPCPRTGHFYSRQVITLNEIIRRALPAIQHYDHLLKRAEDAEREAKRWERKVIQHQQAEEYLRGRMSIIERCVRGEDL